MFEPTTTTKPLRRGVNGTTDPYGNIVISSKITPEQQELALLHEKVHRFFTPKLVFLRHFRISNMQRSYRYSSLWRYLEEMVAQSVALVGKQGWSCVVQGIRFPVNKGYVYLWRAGSRTGLGGRGLFTEGMALLAVGDMAGIGMELWLGAGATHAPTFNRPDGDHR